VQKQNSNPPKIDFSILGKTLHPLKKERVEFVYFKIKVVI